MRRARTLAVWAAMFTTAQLHAIGGTIQDQAVSLTLPSSHWDGSAAADLLGAWPSAGTDPLRAAGYWYRVEGVDTREHRFPPPDSETYGSDGRLIATWDNVAGKGFGATLVMGVFDHERPAGGFTSELVLDHLGGPALTVKIFHYLDVDVPGWGGDDKATSLTPNYLRFTDLGGSVIRYRAQNAERYQIGVYPTLRNALNDGDADTLSNAGAPFGPGDATAAFQWMVNLNFASRRRITGGVSVMVRLPEDYIKGEFGGSLTGFPSLLFQRLSPAEEFFSWDMRRTSLYGSGARTLTPGRRVVAADDFDGDHTTDLVEFAAASGQTFIDGEPVTGALPAPPGWRIEASGDFDADGRPDLVWRSALTHKVVIWRMQGAQRLGDIVPVPDQATDANWQIVAALDFDGDGVRDLLWYNATSGRIVIWTMNAAVQRTAGHFTIPASAGDANWRVVAAGDYGKGPATSGTPVYGSQDIIWRNATSGKLVAWHMDLAGQRTGGVFVTPDSPSDALNVEVVGPR